MLNTLLTVEETEVIVDMIMRNMEIYTLSFYDPYRLPSVKYQGRYAIFWKSRIAIQYITLPDYSFVRASH